MLNKLKRTGLLTLAFSLGLAVMQPAVASAQDWHDRDGHHDRDRRSFDRDRGGDRRDWREHEFRERRDWDRDHRDRSYLYFNYSPAPRYSYRVSPYYNAYPNYNAYPSCPY